MTTALIEVPEIKYSLADDAIDLLREQYMPLQIANIDDKTGFNAVHAARMDVRSRRTAIEKERKELKAGILEAGRAVDGEAKRLADLLEPIESHLQTEESRYNGWIEERKRAAEEAERAKLQQRLDALAEVGAMRHPSVVAVLTDEEFEDTLAQCRQEKKDRDAAEAAAAEERRKEEERIAAERKELERKRQEQEAALAEQRRVEEERLAKEREALEAERRKQSEDQARIDAEKKRLAEQESERIRQEEMKRREHEAEERARREAEEKQRREAEDARAREAAEEADRKRIKALAPDHEKLRAVADAVAEITVPPVSPAAEDVAADIKMLLGNTASRIRTAASLLTKPAPPKPAA